MKFAKKNCRCNDFSKIKNILVIATFISIATTILCCKTKFIEVYNENVGLLLQVPTKPTAKKF